MPRSSLSWQSRRSFSSSLPTAAPLFPLHGLILTTLLDAVRFLAVALITAWFVQAFWRRLISSVFAVRYIGFQEALAIVLMLGVLFAR